MEKTIALVVAAVAAQIGTAAAETYVRATDPHNLAKALAAQNACAKAAALQGLEVKLAQRSGPTGKLVSAHDPDLAVVLENLEKVCAALLADSIEKRHHN